MKNSTVTLAKPGASPAKGGVSKAIMLVAGSGTRFLPATKVQPKEMLPIVDKPVLQYLVEEAVDAGIKDILFVINANKSAVGAHFSRDYNLEKSLEESGKHDLVDKIRNLHTQANFMYVNQDEPLGTGDALYKGRAFVGEEPFALFYADDVMASPKNKPAIKQVIDVYHKYQSPVAGLVRVSKKDVYKYGVIKGKSLDARTCLIEEIIEKPKVEDAPSNLVSVGRFVLTSDVFQYINRVQKRNGEMYLSDALAILSREGNMYGYEIDGTWHDCGSKIGFWKANFELGLQHPEIGNDVKKFLRKYIKNNTI